MTTYHESFPIPQQILDGITGIFSSSMERYISNPDLTESRLTTDEENRWLQDNLAPYVSEKLGYHVDIDIGIFFVSAQNHLTILHVDGVQFPRPENDKSWALNIPLFNAEQGSMIWYDGQYEEALEHDGSGHTWISVKPGETFQIASMLNLTEPYLVRIDAPHQIDNTSSDSCRIVLSVRFNPDLKPKDY